MKELEDLLDKVDPAWGEVEEWLRNAKNPAEVLPSKDPDRGEALVTMQVTTRSTMGAILYETGGLLIDSSWLRILGSGHPKLPRTLPQWNNSRTHMESKEVSPFLLVADDVLGGFYAINSGGLGVALGNIYYFAPDTLQWEDQGRGYSEFIHWCLSGDLESYYESHRWPGWEDEVKMLDGDQAFSIYPPLWTVGSPIGERSRRTAPLAELYEMYVSDRA